MIKLNRSNVMVTEALSMCSKRFLRRENYPENEQGIVWMRFAFEVYVRSLCQQAYRCSRLDLSIDAVLIQISDRVLSASQRSEAIELWHELQNVGQQPRCERSLFELHRRLSSFVQCECEEVAAVN